MVNVIVIVLLVRKLKMTSVLPVTLHNLEYLIKFKEAKLVDAIVIRHYKDGQIMKILEFVFVQEHIMKMMNILVLLVIIVVQNVHIQEILQIVLHVLEIIDTLKITNVCVNHFHMMTEAILIVQLVIFHVILVMGQMQIIVLQTVE